MTTACLRHYTDGELINSLDRERYLSPVIGELCKRLEAYGTLQPASSLNAECPVCKADLEGDFDPANDILTLSVQK